MISRIRVSSMGSRAEGWGEAAARLRWAVDVGTMGLRQRFLSKNMILRTNGLVQPPLLPRPMLHCIRAGNREIET